MVGYVEPDIEQRSVQSVRVHLILFVYLSYVRLPPQRVRESLVSVSAAAAATTYEYFYTVM